MCTSNRFLKGLISPLMLVLMLFFFAACYSFLDQYLVGLLVDLNLKEKAPVLIWITYLGNSLLYLTIFLLAALFFRFVQHNKKWEARAWFLWLCVAFSNVICGILKITLGRARPGLWMQSHEFGFYGFKTSYDYWSFPSGHTTTIMSLAFGLSVLFPRYWVILVSSAVVVALSRVLLIQHYLSDVIVATYLALIEVTILVCFLRKKKWLSEAC